MDLDKSGLVEVERKAVGEQEVMAGGKQVATNVEGCQWEVGCLVAEEEEEGEDSAVHEVGRIAWKQFEVHAGG